MICLEQIILITLTLVSWGVIVCSQSLRTKWIYILVTLLIGWGIVEIIEYLDPPSPHYE